MSSGLRCAAHTLQLAVHDALKEDQSVTSLISKSRNIVKRLRTPNFLYLLKKANKNKPILDCLTRWSSTAEMLKYLLSLKDFCGELHRTKYLKFKTLSEGEWKRLGEVSAALEPSRICTKCFQNEQLTLSDFYGKWYLNKTETMAVGTEFSDLLVDKMNKREKILFKNDVVVSAIFFDPRYKVVLSSAEVDQAKRHLKCVWEKIIKLRPEPETSHSLAENLTINKDCPIDDFELFFQRKEKENQKISDITSSSSEPHIENILDEYHKNQERITDRNLDILKFWTDKKDQHSSLYVLSIVILSVPATQVSVERLFSGLKFILSPLRTNVGEQILEEQLFIRMNKIFFQKDERSRKREREDSLPGGSESIKKKLLI